MDHQLSRECRKILIATVMSELLLVTKCCVSVAELLCSRVSDMVERRGCADVLREIRGTEATFIGERVNTTIG